MSTEETRRRIRTLWLQRLRAHVQDALANVRRSRGIVEAEAHSIRKVEEDLARILVELNKLLGVDLTPTQANPILPDDPPIIRR